MLLKVTFLHGCFSPFLNCTNDTNSHKASHIYIHLQMRYEINLQRNFYTSFEKRKKHFLAKKQRTLQFANTFPDFQKRKH